MSELTARVSHDGRYAPYAYLNPKDAELYHTAENGRIRLDYQGFCVCPFVIVDDDTVPGTVVMNGWTSFWLGIHDGWTVYADIYEESDFAEYVGKVRDGKELTSNDVNAMMNCVRHYNFRARDLRELVTLIDEKDLTLREVSYFVKDFSANSNMITFDKETYGFHSIGGVPGNKITPIIVSIVAAAGITIPKLSTHAITSACGTADSTEIYCNVEMKSDRLKDICEKTGGMMACSDSVYLEAYNTDRIFMHYEHLLGINPRSLMLASIMSDERSSGVTNLLIDIPVGPGQKIPDEKSAKDYERQFVEIGKNLKMKVKCINTDASQPVGFAVGPMLEAIESIRILEGKEKRSSAAEKSCICAGAVLEMAGMENGRKLAGEILESGKAFQKFREIVAAQGGNEKISSDMLSPGKYHMDIISETNGRIVSIDNRKITALAKTAGAPADKKAGLVIHRKIGEPIRIGDPILTIYSDTESRTDDAFEQYTRDPSVIIG